MLKRVLVTGGAGFVGSHLVESLARDGHRVTVFDAFLRSGSHHNAAWLREHFPPEQLSIVRGDVRSAADVQTVVQHADIIYHLAGQVAVTTSVDDPRTDFEINALGTLNVLEAARRTGRRVPVVFSSTNKVYGAMEDIATVADTQRYRYRDLPQGVDERRPLDFHSPYGCSKGAADQYVRDYSRIYGLPTVVFRMSCIYGPRQFGTEDQGWVAHFIIAALRNQPITIYGDGKQVRDVLFVSDLVRAFRLAIDRLERTAGEVFNIGGGVANTMSVWGEFAGMLTAQKGHAIDAKFGDWRPGDQPCYVSDIRKAADRMGWRPLIDKATGIRRLWEWATANQALFDIEPRRVA